MATPNRDTWDHWRSGGGRRTEQRDRVVDHLERQLKPVTAQELFVKIGARGTGARVSLATVYRTLNDLVAAGLVDVIRRESGEQAFLKCDRGHHHHLTCRCCGKVEEVRDCRLANWAHAAGKALGFTQIEHQAELVGTCASCQGR